MARAQRLGALLSILAVVAERLLNRELPAKPDGVGARL